MFTFDNEYILKSMLASVRDEGDRIVSLGLATHGDVKNLVGPALQTAIKQATNGIQDKSVLMNTLTILHRDLSSVFLPGDFEKVAGPEVDKLHQMLDLPIESEQEDVKPEVVPEGIDEEEADPLEILSTLENIAYNLGKTGNHKAAYLVERRIRKIEALIVSVDENLIGGD